MGERKREREDEDVHETIDATYLADHPDSRSESSPERNTIFYVCLLFSIKNKYYEEFHETRERFATSRQLFVLLVCTCGDYMKNLACTITDYMRNPWTSLSA